MQKEEAEKYLKNIIFDKETQLYQYMRTKNQINGIRHIKQITGCDDQICKEIYIDLYELFSEKRREEINSFQPTVHKSTQNLPTCPTCGSTNVQKISGTKRWLSTGLFGLASSDVGKTMKCKNCGYKW